jgi:glycosyltransferase involved in cell wall biosynthesis
VAVAALARGASYTLLIHDCYPEQLVAVKALRPTGSAARTLDLLNRWLYKHARKLIVVGRDMRELLRRKTSGLNVPIVVIPNWGEVESVMPAPRAGNSLLAELGLQDKFVFLHAGNIGRPTDVESIVDCAAMLATDDRFRFLFIGSGVKRSWIENRIRENGLQNIVLLEPMPRSSQIEFLNACDVGMVALVDGMLGAAMPSKTYNILAAGKPVLALCHPDSELATVIDEEGVGWHIQPGDPERLRSLILEIYAQRAQLEEMGTRARQAAEAKYRFASAIERYRGELAVGLSATSNVAPAVDVARPLERG